MDNRSDSTLIGFSSIDKCLIWAVPPIIGGVLGWFIPGIAKWAGSLAWVPFQGQLELIASFHGPWVMLVTAFIGFLGGIWLSHAAINESLHLRVSDKEVRLAIRGSEESFTKDEVAAVFMDGKQLVLLGMEDQELYREKPEANHRQVEKSFNRHGYPWREDDPFTDQYSRWVSDAPELTPSLNALFKAREKSLVKDEKEDADDLRRELSKLGVVVRDEGKHQFWRPYGQWHR